MRCNSAYKRLTSSAYLLLQCPISLPTASAIQRRQPKLQSLHYRFRFCLSHGPELVPYLQYISTINLNLSPVRITHPTLYTDLTHSRHFLPSVHTTSHSPIGILNIMSPSGMALRAAARVAPKTASRAAAAAVVPIAARTLNTNTNNRNFSTSSQVLAASSPNHGRLREIVAQTVSSIGSKRESQQYLKLFTSVSSQKFAVIKVGGAILTDYLHELSHSLLFLYELGLYPIIVHGAGPQLNQLLEDAGVEPQFEEGIRVTDAKTLGIARKLFLQENLRFTNCLDELGVATRSISGVFEAEYLDKDKWQYVGKITKVNKEAIEKSIEAGYIPIMTSMAESSDGHLLNVNADVA